MKSIFIAKLQNLHLVEDIGPGEKIGDILRITNDVTKIRTLIAEPYKLLLGAMEIGALLDGGPVIYSELDIPDVLTPVEYLVTLLYEVESFLKTTWISYDNSINCEMGFLLYRREGEFLASSNFINHHNTTSRGEVVTTELTREELRAIRRLHSNAMSPVGHQVSPPVSMLTGKKARFPRALFFISAARGECDIAIKIAHYCTAFETLFSSSQTELAHQLSERISFFLFLTPSERHENYKKVKAAYNIRSRVVHGSTFPENKLSSTTDIAEYCDFIARKICRKYFFEGSDIFEMNQEDFEEAMLRLIFGVDLPVIS